MHGSFPFNGKYSRQKQIKRFETDLLSMRWHRKNAVLKMRRKRWIRKLSRLVELRGVPRVGKDQQLGRRLAAWSARRLCRTLLRQQTEREYERGQQQSTDGRHGTLPRQLSLMEV